MAATASFRRATRHQLRLRMAIDGPPGAGKTFTALRAATLLANSPGNENPGRIAVINTESGAVCKYLGLSPDGTAWTFDIAEPANYSPSTYTDLILAAGRDRYDVLIIDSLSHAWEGEGGALDQVDRKSGDGGNKFTAWKDVTPQHRCMIEAILRSPCHVIATMRTKTDYVLETNDRGKVQPRKVGVKTVQREGIEYEFDVVCDMDVEHVLHVSKSRCPEIDGLIVCKPSASTFEPLVRWLAEGSAAPEDYYARSEEDLRTEQKALQARKTPEQKRREAARQQGASSAAAIAASKQADSDPTTAPAAPGVLDRIESLAEEVCQSADDLLAIVRKHCPSASRLSQLTHLQAQMVIGDLLTKQGAVAPDAPQEHLDLDDRPSSITEVQLQTLKSLAITAQWSVEGPDGQEQWLKSRGLASFRGLSMRQAATLIGQLHMLIGQLHEIASTKNNDDDIPF